MKRHIFFSFVFLLCLLILLSSCSITKRIPVAFYKDNKSDILQSGLVKSIRLSFLKPALNIDISLSEIVDDDEIARILELTKAFVTIEKMDSIAKHVGWDQEIWYAKLRITNNTDKKVLAEYYAEYYKRNRKIGDYSPENIDEYRTWKIWG